MALRSRFLAVALTAVLGGAAAATPGVWNNVAGPNGYNGQLSSLYSNGKTLFAGSGFARVFSAPLAAVPQWTALSQTGLAFPYLIDSLVANAADQVVLSVVNVNNVHDAGLRAWDAQNMTWKAVGPAFQQPPRLAATAAGDFLASVSDTIWASSDGGMTWALRVTLTTQIAAPAPLPQGGNAAGMPGYLTNALTPDYPGYTETFNVMPWGEIMLGNETLAMWHSLDDGYTWESIDPLFYVPHRDSGGVPWYKNQHITTFGHGNTAGAGVTKDGELLVNCDRNNGHNFYRYTTTGELVPPDFAPVWPIYTDANKNMVPVHVGQVRSFCLTRSGDTLSSSIIWFDGQAGVSPDGRNPNDVIGWDGAKLSIVTPAAGSWAAAFSDGARCASDGAGVFVLGTTVMNNVMRWVPQAQANERPDVKPAGGPVTVTIDAVSGYATIAPARLFTVADDGLPSGKLGYAWSARGPAPVLFDAPLAQSSTAWLRVPGDYVLTLTVDDGQASSGSGAIVHVLPAKGGQAPVITQQPTNQKLTVGQPVTLSLVAAGPQLSYQWRRNGIELVDGVAFTGTTSPQLRIVAATAAEWDAIYDCRVASPFGRAMSHGATMGGPVVITTDPASATVPMGAQVTLSVAADGSQPMRWQWHSTTNGVRAPLQGANQPILTTAAPGTYSVDVTNYWGTVSSAAAQITNGNGATFNLSVTNGGGTTTPTAAIFAGAGGVTAHLAITADRFGSPGQGSRFSGWTTSMGQLVTFGDASQSQTYMVVNNAAPGAKVYVAANYQATAEWRLAVVNGVGSGVTRIDTFAPGAKVQIAALAPPPGFAFDHWVGAPVDGAVDPSPVFMMPAAETRLVATYRSLAPPPDGGAPDLADPLADMTGAAPADLAMGDAGAPGGGPDLSTVAGDLAVRADAATAAADAAAPSDDAASAPGASEAGCGCRVARPPRDRSAPPTTPTLILGLAFAAIARARRLRRS